MTMRRTGLIRTLVTILAILLAGLPAAFVATVLTFPFWRWLEERFGIEAYGHSGPAEWCFWVVYGLLVVLALGLWWRGRRREVRRRDDSG